MVDINVKLKPQQGIKVKTDTVYVFNPSAFEEYIDISEDWAKKTDGLVEETDYSSKAYAIGGVGTETNNSKYYAGQAATSATSAEVSVANAKQWAIGDPTEPTGGSSKYWAQQASSTVGNCANKDLSNLSVTGEAKFVKPSELATVATTGSYNDLLNKPTIPTVNNATLTLTQGGTTKGTFTANASSDVTIDLDAGGSNKADVDLSNVNNSGKSIAAGWAMPSTFFEALTLGASGASYTAPKNGYFDLRKGANAGEYIKITGQVEIAISQATNDSALSCFTPVKKGDSVSIFYTASGTTYLFRFVYAEGDK